MAGVAKSRTLFFHISVYVVLPGALILLLLIGWMLAVDNATVVLQSTDSPDGRYRAQVVREDPGVSSNYKYMVRVAPARLPPLAARLGLLPFGPFYTALDIHHEPDKLTVRWTGPQGLTIQCKGCLGATEGKSQWRDIELKYVLN